MRYRTIALILMMSIWFGCGSDEMGTLELKINNPKESSITQARVWVDGKYKTSSFNLSEDPYLIDLDVGRHVVSVHLLDEKGDQLHAYGPMVIEINVEEVTPLELRITSVLGTLELKIEKPQDSLITQVRVRIDDTVVGAFELIETTTHLPFTLKAGEHRVELHFLDGAGNLIHAEPSQIVPIQAELTRKIDFNPPHFDEILVENWILTDIILEIEKNIDPVPLDPEGKTLKISGGKTKAIAWLVEVEDPSGNPIENKTFIVSNDSTLDSGTVEWVEVSEDKIVYKGYANGQFTMYLGGEVIFEGIYTTHPPENLRMSIKPSQDEPGKFDLVEFTQLMFAFAIGKNKYENHILKGTAQITLKGVKGDLVMSQELGLYRTR